MRSAAAPTIRSRGLATAPAAIDPPTSVDYDVWHDTGCQNMTGDIFRSDGDIMSTRRRTIAWLIAVTAAATVAAPAAVQAEAASHRASHHATPRHAAAT